MDSGRDWTRTNKMSFAHHHFGCVARILAALKTEAESFMPFYQAERLIYEQAQPDPFNK